MAANSGIPWIDTLFDGAVTSLYWAANLLGVTYEEINVYIFIIVWPLQTIVQVIWFSCWFRKKRTARRELPAYGRRDPAF